MRGLVEQGLLEPIPFGYCRCRCGGLAPIAKLTITRKGYVRGQPVRFIHGHHARVYPFDFWSRVDKTTTPDGCWPFTGHLDQDGYGRIKVNGRWRVATHIALELSGFIPWEGLQVRHYVCNNPPCCRPSHLKIGTPKEDAEDKVSQGRQARGERQGAAKLRQADADEIRRLYAADISRAALARRFDVSWPAIDRLVRGEIWKP